MWLYCDVYHYRNVKLLIMYDHDNAWCEMYHPPPFIGEFIKLFCINNWVERESERSNIRYIPAALFIYHYKDGFAILFQSKSRLFPTDSNSILQWKARPAARKRDKLSLNATLYLN